MNDDAPIEVARSESGRGELVLRRRGAVIELRANGVFVMDTAETTTERALASAALARSASPSEVLVGGLGLGFTAHEVLADPRVERCTVVEIEDALVGWMRDGTIPHGPELLAQSRLRVVVADVADALREAPDGNYDLVLLDVDNGPGYLVHDANAALYGTRLLGEVQRILTPAGSAVIWSAQCSDDLERTMAAVFGNCAAEGLTVDLQGRDERYWLYTSRT